MSCSEEYPVDLEMVLSWTILEEPTYAIVTSEFESTSPDHLPLRVRDRVRILKKREGWFQGFHVSKPEKAGHFPSSCVSIKPLSLLKNMLDNDRTVVLSLTRTPPVTVINGSDSESMAIASTVNRTSHIIDHDYTHFSNELKSEPACSNSVSDDTVDQRLSTITMKHEKADCDGDSDVDTLPEQSPPTEDEEVEEEPVTNTLDIKSLKIVYTNQNNFQVSSEVIKKDLNQFGPKMSKHLSESLDATERDLKEILEHRAIPSELAGPLAGLLSLHKTPILYEVEGSKRERSHASSNMNRRGRGRPRSINPYTGIEFSDQERAERKREQNRRAARNYRQNKRNPEGSKKARANSMYQYDPDANEASNDSRSSLSSPHSKQDNLYCEETITGQRDVSSFQLREHLQECS